MTGKLDPSLRSDTGYNVFITGSENKRGDIKAKLSSHLPKLPSFNKQSVENGTQKIGEWCKTGAQMLSAAGKSTAGFALMGMGLVKTPFSETLMKTGLGLRGKEVKSEGKEAAYRREKIAPAFKKMWGSLMESMGKSIQKTFQGIWESPKVQGKASELAGAITEAGQHQKLGGETTQILANYDLENLKKKYGREESTVEIHVENPLQKTKDKEPEEIPEDNLLYEGESVKHEDVSDSEKKDDDPLDRESWKKKDYPEVGDLLEDLFREDDEKKNE